MTRATECNIAASAAGGIAFGRLRVSAGAAFVLAGILGPVGFAHGQTFSTTINPVVSPDYSRDRNVSVLEEAHPDYDALGINAGGFNFFPQVSTGVGATNNTYNNDADKQASTFLVLQPSVFARSDWSRHQLTVQVSDDTRRYLGQSPRNQDSWFTDVAGRVDVSEQLTVRMDVQAARFFEAPFSSDATSTNAVLSNYLRKYAGLDLGWTEGRVRLAAGYNRNSLNFNTLRFPNGQVVDQAYRNRLYDLEYVRSEFALSPSTSVYAQSSFDRVSYDLTVASGVPSRNSNGEQVIAGLSFDLAGLLRGNVGVGYSHRSFDAAIYSSISGFSAQGKVDFFLSPLTTLTVSGQRTLQDSSLGTASGFWDERVMLEVDHSLRENIIITPQVQLVHQSFVGLEQSRDYFAGGLSGKIQFNRELSVRANMGYSHSQGSGSILVSPFTEVTGTISVQYRR